MSERDVVGTDVTAPLPGFGPVAPRERIETLDFLRGFAIFGIILSDVDSIYRILGASEPVAKFLYSFFVWDKFWPLLSFLFGLGFALLILRAEARGTPFLWVYARRLFVLLLIGLTSVVFIGGGSFLYRYALLGFVLLAFRRRSPRLSSFAIWRSSRRKTLIRGSSCRSSVPESTTTTSRRSSTPCSNAASFSPRTRRTSRR